jgi:AcrR family transcriptional regulator
VVQSRAYHHGNLRQALIDAALSLAAEGGPENVTMREAARRAGVSSGAPFRHFADRTALMTAVAEEAMSRLRAEISLALEAVAGAAPAVVLRAMGLAYLRWARTNPTHFEIVSARRQIDFAGSAALTGDLDLLQNMMDEILAAAAPQIADARLVRITTRALVYGLARMYVDGQFPTWRVADDEVEAVMTGALDLFIALLLRPATP